MLSYRLFSFGILSCGIVLVECTPPPGYHPVCDEIACFSPAGEKVGWMYVSISVFHDWSIPSTTAVILDMTCLMPVKARLLFRGKRSK